eukprot:1553757-Rhodomonas_salina.1
MAPTRRAPGCEGAPGAAADPRRRAGGPGRRREGRGWGRGAAVGGGCERGRRVAAERVPGRL